MSEENRQSEPSEPEEVKPQNAVPGLAGPVYHNSPGVYVAQNGSSLPASSISNFIAHPPERP